MSSMKDLLEDVRVLALQGCSNEYIASSLEISEAQVEGAIDILMDDLDFQFEFRCANHFRDKGRLADDSMDGDTASALASAGWGTDEDYGSFSEEY